MLPCALAQAVIASLSCLVYDVGLTPVSVSRGCDGAAGHVVEVRTPRYFDSGDTEGYQKAEETWTYNGRGQVLTHTESTGAGSAT